jgi:hypothetical protein
MANVISSGQQIGGAVTLVILAVIGLTLLIGGTAGGWFESHEGDNRRIQQVGTQYTPICFIWYNLAFYFFPSPSQIFPRYQTHSVCQSVCRQRSMAKHTGGSLSFAAVAKAFLTTTLTTHLPRLL